MARVEDRNKYKGDICCSQCYFYLVCVSPGKVLYPGVVVLVGWTAANVPILCFSFSPNKYN